MITVRGCEPGDVGRMNAKVGEKDAFAGWAQHIEQNAGGLTRFDYNGVMLMVMGYMEVWDGVAEAFALVDRTEAAGHGKELAAAVRQKIVELMDANGLHRIEATADPHDRVALVFLRATGYRFESIKECGAPDGTDLHVYTIIRRPSHG